MTRTIPTSSISISDIQRMFQNIVINGECIELKKLIHNPEAISKRAHVTILGKSYSGYRVIYTLCFGPIPSGFEIDHMCGNPACIRPTHLQAVTPDVNKRFPRKRILIGGKL